MTTLLLTSISIAQQQEKSLWYTENVLIQTMCVQSVPAHENLTMFAPTKSMVFGHKHWKHGTNWERFASYPQVSDLEYRERYDEILKTYNPYIEEWYSNLPSDPDVVIYLCCFCRPGTFCHRRRVYKYLKEVIEPKMKMGHAILLDPTSEDIKDMKLERSQRTLAVQPGECVDCVKYGICDKHQEEAWGYKISHL